MAVNIEKFDFDPEKLRQKYREERDKRVRSDGNDQYKEVKGEFSYFVEDPYVEEKKERESLKLHTEIAIIGGGFGGMLAAARIREAGFDDFKIIEKGGDFGGTWYWNRYPGASVASSIPKSFVSLILIFSFRILSSSFKAFISAAIFFVDSSLDNSKIFNSLSIRFFSISNLSSPVNSFSFFAWLTKFSTVIFRSSFKFLDKPDSIS